MRCLCVCHYANDFSPEPWGIHQTFSIGIVCLLSHLSLVLEKVQRGFTALAWTCPLLQALGNKRPYCPSWAQPGIVLPRCFPLCPAIREAFQKYISCLRQSSKVLLSPKGEMAREFFYFGVEDAFVTFMKFLHASDIWWVITMVIKTSFFFFFISVVILGRWASHSQRIGKCASSALGKAAAVLWQEKAVMKHLLQVEFRRHLP